MESRARGSAARRAGTQRGRWTRLEGTPPEEQAHPARTADPRGPGGGPALARAASTVCEEERGKPRMADAARVPAPAGEALRVQGAARQGGNQAPRALA